MRLIAHDAAKQSCPLCRERIDLLATAACGGCATRYHEDCWAELRGCATLGCASDELAGASRRAAGACLGLGAACTCPACARWDWSRLLAARPVDWAQERLVQLRVRAARLGAWLFVDRRVWEDRALTALLLIAVPILGTLFGVMAIAGLRTLDGAAVTAVALATILLGGSVVLAAICGASNE